MKGRCENCRFWDSSTSKAENENSGICRVSAPVVDFRTGNGLWPFTESHDWCGLYLGEAEKLPPAPPPPKDA